MPISFALKSTIHGVYSTYNVAFCILRLLTKKVVFHKKIILFTSMDALKVKYEKYYIFKLTIFF